MCELKSDSKDFSHNKMSFSKVTRLKITILIISFFYVEVNMQIVPKSSEIFSKELFLDKDNDHLVTDIDGLSYAVFKKESDESNIIDCNVTSASNVKTRIPTKQCNYKIRSQVTVYFMDTINIRSLGEDKVILCYILTFDFDTKKATFKVIIIDMKDCKSTDINFITKYEFFYVSPYKNTFDIVTSDKSYCKGQLCISTFDHSGNRIGEPIIISKPIKKRFLGDAVVQIKAVAPRISTDSKGYYIYIDRFKHNESHIFSVNPDGSIKESMTMKQSKQEYYPSFTSSEHELFSICLLNEDNAKVNCSQMDKDLNVILNSTFNFPDGADTKIKNIHSLKDRGILIGVIDKDGVYRIYKMNKTGKIEDQYIVLSNLNCPIGQYRQSYYNMFESEDKFCFSSHCEYEADSENGDHKLVVKCILQSVIP